MLDIYGSHSTLKTYHMSSFKLVGRVSCSTRQTLRTVNPTTSPIQRAKSPLTEPHARFAVGTTRGKSEYISRHADPSHILVGDDLPAKSFKGYFCARFSEPFVEAGISKHGKKQLVDQGQGEVLAGWVTFNSTVVEVRVGVSFLSVEQARR